MAPPQFDSYIQPMKSPCIKVCKIDEPSRLCLGCFRTLEEIATWARLTDAQRDQVMNDLDRRRLAFAAG
ncbi:DUF1289 domain-containing protein [Roseibium aquae]|uniref:DUF1289 domain-containing protein n=1 Tax=Roseibium aquae TaxID=1323746 RepID=UPI001FCC0887|nr:DUF1289 domain-containing protein [Roseibium aquae]